MLFYPFEKQFDSSSLVICVGGEYSDLIGGYALIAFALDRIYASELLIVVNRCRRYDNNRRDCRNASTLRMSIVANSSKIQ